MIVAAQGTMTAYAEVAWPGIQDPANIPDTMAKSSGIMGRGYILSGIDPPTGGSGIGASRKGSGKMGNYLLLRL